MATEKTKTVGGDPVEILPPNPVRPPLMLNLDALKNCALLIGLGIVVGIWLVKSKKL